MDNSTDKVGLVEWLTHCDKKLGKKTENSITRKKLVGRKFSYLRSRVGTWNTSVSKQYKVNNSSDGYYSKGLDPNAPVFTPSASIAKSVSSTNTSSISSRSPPVVPPSLHPKLNNSSLHHRYNVEIKNKFAALFEVDESEDIGSNLLFQKTKARQCGPGKKGAVKIKKPNIQKMTVTKPLGMMNTANHQVC